MPIITFSEKDILRGTLIDPGWYRIRVESVGEALSKDKGSTNYPVSATVLFNGDNGDTKFKGCPIDWNFNSKAMGFATGFVKALGINPVAGERLELANAAGKELDIFIEPQEFEGVLRNRANHKYRAPNPEVSAKE